MQKTIVTALAVLATTTVALATDLPSKTSTPTAPAVPFFAQGTYVGVNVGGDINKATVYSGGAVAGWNALPFLAVEGTYDFSRPQAKVGKKFNYENTVALNVLPQYKIPATDLTAYAVGGIGYRFDSVSTVTDHAVYNYGGGIKYDFAKNLELDARFTRLDDVKKKYQTSSPAENRATVGVNYKF
jgi:opacity protein-like surface antigen